MAADRPQDRVRNPQGEAEIETVVIDGMVRDVGPSMGRAQRLRIMVCGIALLILGFVTPWYTVEFTPPEGSLRLGGDVLEAFRHSYDGLALKGTAQSESLRTITLVLLVLCAIDVAALLGVAPDRLRRLLERFPSHILDAALSYMKAAAQILHGLVLLTSLVGLVLLTKWHYASGYAFADKYGTGEAATSASKHLHIHFGVGLWLMVCGLLVVSAPVAREIKRFLLVFVVGGILLLMFRRSWLELFYSHLSNYWR